MSPVGSNNSNTCCGAVRYSVSAVLIVLLLGLLPAACSDPEGKAVSQGTPRAATEGSDMTEEQPKGGDMSEPNGEDGDVQDQQSEKDHQSDAGQGENRPPDL
jgi:hypothetical protein